MPSSMNISLIVFVKIILPVIIWSLYLLGLSEKIYSSLLYLSIFGLVMVCANYGRTRHNYFLALLMSSVLSNIVFYASLFIPGLINYLITGGETDGKNEGKILGIDFKDIWLLATISIIAPCLMFLSQKILFKITESTFVKTTRFATILILLIIGVLADFWDKNKAEVYWQITMLIAMQLLIYGEDLKPSTQRNPPENDAFNHL